MLGHRKVTDRIGLETGSVATKAGLTDQEPSRCNDMLERGTAKRNADRTGHHVVSVRRRQAGARFHDHETGASGDHGLDHGCHKLETHGRVQQVSIQGALLLK